MVSDDEQFQQAMEQGHSEAWEGMWDRAAGFYRQALQFSPGHPRALSSLALALFEQHDDDQSLHYYIKAAQASPEDPISLEKIAQLYERLGRIDRAMAAALHSAELYIKNREVDKAIQCWDQVLDWQPENITAHSRLALVHERLGQEKQAVVEYIHIAGLFQQGNELEKARRTLQHALQVFPGNRQVLQALEILRAGQRLPQPTRPSNRDSRSWSSQERSQGPSQEAETAVGLDPISEARRTAIAALAALLFDSPEETYQGPVPGPGVQPVGYRAGSRQTPGAYGSRILLHLRQLIQIQTEEDHSRAIEELEGAIQAGLSLPAANCYLGILYFECSQLESTVGPLSEAMKHPDYAMGAGLLLGRTLAQLEHWPEAAAAYLEALRLADVAVISATSKDEVAEDLRQFYEPILAEQRQERDTGTHQRLCANIDELLVKPAWRERLQSARQSLLTPSDGGGPVPFAEILAQSSSILVVESFSRIKQLAVSGHLRSALEEAYYGLQLAPTYLPLHTCIAELLIKQEHLAEAVAKLLIVAKTYSIRGETRRAVDLYRRVIELGPMDLTARALFIDLLTSLSRWEEAVQEYLNYADVSYDLADLDMARKALQEGLRLAQNIHLDSSWRAKILHKLADIDVQSLDWRQALRLFDQIRTLQPGDEKARQKLVELNFRLDQEGQALAELDNYLTYLLNSGRKSQAIPFLENLVREGLNRPAIHSRLGRLSLTTRS